MTQRLVTPWRPLPYEEEEEEEYDNNNDDDDKPDTALMRDDLTAW